MKGWLDITDFGACADGVTSNTKVFEKAFAELERLGGGTVYVPAGNYLTGPIILKSNTTLYLSRGAVILGSHDVEEFPPVDFIEGYTRHDFTSLVTAFNAENISVEGGGTIDARGWFWWEHHRKDYRPRTFQPILCKNVLIRDVTIKNSPMWTVHPLCCDNVTIDRVSIINPPHSPNTDGINPESCSNVHISNCYIDVGDDCVTLKAGTEDDPLSKAHACENITVTNCTMLHGHGGVVIGSEMSGGVRHVTISNCVFMGTDRGIRIKTRRRRGGRVSDILVNNIYMQDVLAPLTINEFYFWGIKPEDEWLLEQTPMTVEDSTPTIENICLSNIVARGVRIAAIYMKGLPEKPIRGITLNNVTIEMNNPERIVDTPVSIRGSECCLKGIVMENVTDAKFTAVHISGQEGEMFELKNVQMVNE